VSSRKRRLKILPEAKVHIRGILKFTQQRWGEDQRLAYKKKLHDAFALILTNPFIGKKRDEIRQGYRSFCAGKHYIFYTVYDDRIEIVALIHESMDIESFFNA
jgi:toxin ParE1/3/4